MFTSHEIQYMEGKVIKSKMENINNFAVDVKMVLEDKGTHDYEDGEDDIAFKSSKEELANEVKETTTREISIDDLCGEERVTFISGVAGIGKSVLAKQIVYRWANQQSFKTFDLCLYFQCRELNEFYQENQDKKLSKSELLDKFVMKTLNCDVLDAGSMLLIVIDGIDELYDINDEHSIIFKFLDKQNSLYRKSTILLTGRPHVKNVIDTPGKDIGKCKVVEIIGIDKDDIPKYINKFSKCSGQSIRDEKLIKDTIDSSSVDGKILRVPQFLNTVCCISLLKSREKIESVMELYAWVLFLLLKQHVCERDPNFGKRLPRRVFGKCKEVILLLSEISFHLYEKNEIIFEKSSFDAVFNEIDKKGSKAEKEFADSLFTEVPDHYVEKLEFKHLTLMEFMAAVHVSNHAEPIKIIKDLLIKKQFNVVGYVCDIGGGILAGRRILKDLFESVTEKARKNNAGSLLIDVMKAISDCYKDDESTRMRKLLKLASHLHGEVTDKAFIQELFSELHSDSYYPKQVDQANMLKVYEYLKRCGCDGKEIREVFKNVGLSWLSPISVEIFQVVKYFQGVGVLILCGAVLNGDAMKSIEEGFLCCKCVDIYECEFKDAQEEERNQEDFKLRDSKLEDFQIKKCKMNGNSFRKAFTWGVSSEFFLVKGIEITPKWWLTFLEEIIKRKNRGDLKLKYLLVDNCAINPKNDIIQKVKIY